MQFSSHWKGGKLPVSRPLVRLRYSWNRDIRDLFEFRSQVNGQLFAVFPQDGHWQDEHRHALLVIARLINVYGTDEEKTGPHTWGVTAPRT